VLNLVVVAVLCDCTGLRSIIAVLHDRLLFNPCKVEQYVLTVINEDYYYYFFSTLGSKDPKGKKIQNELKSKSIRSSSARRIQLPRLEIYQLDCGVFWGPPCETICHLRLSLKMFIQQLKMYLFGHSQ